MDDVVRYRLGWRQLPWYLGFLPFANVLAASGWSGLADMPPALLAGPTLVLVAAVALLRQMGVELRPDALVMHGLRRRVIPWSDVADVRVGRMLGSWMVYVTTAERSFMLRAPTHTAFFAPDRRFAAKSDAIVRRWTERRGADWRPPAHWVTWAAPGTAGR